MKTIWLSLVLTAAVCGQSFEVATLKLSPPRSGEDGFTKMGETPGRLAYANITARLLISIAYSMNDEHIIGAPGWADTTYYDLAATFPAALSNDDVHGMLRELLKERLALEVHTTEKAEKGFGLVIDARGAKLKVSRAAKPRAQFDTRRGEILAEGAAIGSLAGMLARVIGGPVEDLTHLDGAYDIELKWAPETTDPNAVPSSKPPISVALTEQLGLKLKPQPVMVKRLVVDKLQRVPKEE